MTGRYAVLRRPRVAWVDQASPHPARFWEQLVRHALNHGMPAARRGGVALALAGRGSSRVPAGALARAAVARPTRANPGLDRLRDALAAAWPGLAGASDRLPAAVPELSLLAIERGSGTFVFVFGDGPHPLVLLKPDGGAPGAEVEDGVLRLTHAAACTPRVLPVDDVARDCDLPGLRAQEGVPGRPLTVLPTDAVGWSADLVEPLDHLGEGLLELGRLTGRPGRPELLDARLGACLQVTGLAARTARLVAAARRDLLRLERTTLAHRDLSAQNWLVDGPRLAGLVDWETARPADAPGHDVLHAAVALVEHGVALRRWSQEAVVDTFTRAWADEPVLTAARDWHARLVVAATDREDLVEPLRLAFFAARLGRRAQGGGPERLTEDTVRRMLGVVAGW